VDGNSYPAGLGFDGPPEWKLRVTSYAAFLRDEYPPFSLNVGGPGAAPATTGGEMPPPPPMPLVPPPVPPAPPDTGP
jgi:hypothetical protein